MKFDLHIGIDYSGAEYPEARLKVLQVFAAGSHAEPARVAPPSQPPDQWWNWSRREIAEWIVALGHDGRRFIVGIDHAFSFPATYFERYGLRSWDAFLADFCRHWPTHEECQYVDFVRPGNRRTGDASALRLTDRWTAAANSVFQMEGHGAVGKAAHAGIPWLAHIRKALGDRIHVWPFDGWDVPDDRSVIAEVSPAIFRRRYPAGERGPDAQDAYAIARWLREADERDMLERYFHPPLTDTEARQARLEGWTLGIG